MSNPSRAPRWHYAILAIWPLLLTLLNRNWAYGDLYNYDGWYCFGDFLHFPRIHLLEAAYPHERVPWILAGSTLVRLFGVVWGLFALHYLAVWAGLCLMYFIVRRVTDNRTALLGTVMMGCSSAFLGPNGWAYPDGLLLICVLAGVAFLMRRPEDDELSPAAVLGSGAALAIIVTMYPLWVCLAPAYFFLMLRMGRGREFQWPAALRVGGIAVAGAAACCFAMWAIYLAMGGRGFIFTKTLEMSLMMSKSGNVPWVHEDWMKEPVWLVLPALALCLAVIGLIEYWRRRNGFSRTYRDLLWFYVLCLAIMVVLTILPTRILALDFKTLVLVPAIFLTFTLVVFRVPEATPDWLFYVTGLAAAAISLSTLAVPELYKIAYHREFLIPAFALTIAVSALRIWRPSHTMRWSAGVLLFSIACFGIVPSYYRAWLLRYRGPDIVERVGRATRVVLARLPADAVPVFWYQDGSEKLSPEFQGVMCAFMGGPRSILSFPKVDHALSPMLTRVLTPGARIFLLRETDDAVAVAQYAMAASGMPVTVKSKDRIEYGDAAYWITQFEVQPFSMSALREGFVAARRNEPALEFASAEAVRTASRVLNVEEPGVYQIELRYPRQAGKPKFGALRENGGWLEESSTASDGPDEIAWFRRGVEGDEPLNLRAEWKCASAPCQPAAAEIKVFRDTSGADARVFNLIRGRAIPNNDLLPGGNFETGLDGWSSPKGSSIRASQTCHSGGCAEFLPAGTEVQYLVSNGAVKLKKGRRYEFSAWMRSNNGKPVRLECGLWDGARQRWVGRADFTATAEWSQAKLRFVGDTDAPLSPIFWQSRGDFGPMLVDDVNLKAIAAALPDGNGQMLANGGFEDALTGWTTGQGQLVEGSHCHTGTCVEFRPQGTQTQYLVSWDAATLVKGKTYELSAWLRSGTGKPLRLRWGFWDKTANDWVAAQTVTAGPEWTNVKTRFVSGLTGRLSPIFWQSQGEYGAMLADDVALVEINAPVATHQ